MNKILFIVLLIFIIFILGIYWNNLKKQEPINLVEIEKITGKIEINNQNKIPKIIHKTFKTNLVSQSMRDAFMSWKELNPDYEIRFYDNEDIEDFLIEHFDENVLKTYRSLIPGAYKADLFRFCVLYINGGIYSDVGQVCLEPLSKLIDKNDEFITAKDIPDCCIQMSFIATVPKHPFLKMAIDKIVENVGNRYYGSNYLDITGPLMFGKVINKILNRNENDIFEIGGDNKFKLMKFLGDGQNMVYENLEIIKTKYENYNLEKVKISSLPVYGILWRDRKVYNNFDKTPKIIHLIYIPWDRKTQILKEDPYDFDINFASKLQENNINFDVKLWTLPKIKEFLKKHYSQYYDKIMNVARPVMIVDIVRLLLVYHYGGIYWQYGSKNLVDFDKFLPSKNKDVKLFTETIISKEFAEKSKQYPIRDGFPEELLRVYLGFFSAIPKNEYILTLFKTTIENIEKYEIKCDYDILYTTGNAMMSEVYDKIGKFKDNIELVDFETTHKMIKVNSSGSWRTD